MSQWNYHKVLLSFQSRFMPVFLIVIFQILGVFCFENVFSGQDGVREGKGGAPFFGRFSAQKKSGSRRPTRRDTPKKNGIWFEKNPQKLIFCGSKYFCGVAGSRTRVQTSNQKTFYTLIFCLGFRCLVWTETTAKHLSFLMSTQPQSMAEFRFIFTIRLYRPL